MKWPVIVTPLIVLACGQLDRTEGFRRFAKPLGSREWSGAIEAPAAPAWKTRIDVAGERGDPLIVSGTIYLPDGKTPSKGAMLYVYHTDSTGHYSRGSGTGNGRRHGKLRGWMLTGADGKYEFRTIRPSPYPGRTAEAHIHATLTAEGFPEHWIDEYLFAGDPLIPARIAAKSAARGSFAFILTPNKGADGIWRAKRDLRIEKPTKDNGGS
jgi:protocatechuate 3,4-dioxygenase beta subunit